MKKLAGVGAALCALLAQQLFAQDGITNAQRKFIKGSIVDKTAAVREASGSERQLAESGLDFVIAYQPLLGNDRDLAALAIASILALPKAEGADAEYVERISEKLVKAFNLFADETVRITVLEKLVLFAARSNSEKAVTLMNTYLADAAKKSKEASSVMLATLSAIGKVGNSNSFAIVYNIWQSGCWEAQRADVEAALVGLSESSVSDAIKVIVAADIRETKAFFTLLTKNAKKSQNFIAEIAENVLSKAIYTVEGSSVGSDVVDLQIAALKILADSHWTRASKLVIGSFATAKSEYASGAMSEMQFIDVITSVAKLASPDSAVTLASYLSDLNKGVAENNTPAKSVVLAVISALGELGDKAAFDTLLYVTYLSYPDDVIRAAREALARLKW